MSVKKIRAVKADKGFKIFDLIIYGAIIAVVVVLFVVLFATKEKGDLGGVEIYLDNVVVFRYDFESKNYDDVLKDGTVEVEEDGDGLTVTVRCEEGFNKIRFENGTVRVTDADCGKKDCVYSPALKDKNGVIYCSPHKLKIVPSDFSPTDDPDIIM